MTDQSFPDIGKWKAEKSWVGNITGLVHLRCSKVSNWACEINMLRIGLDFQNQVKTEDTDLRVIVYPIIILHFSIAHSALILFKQIICPPKNTHISRLVTWLRFVHWDIKRTLLGTAGVVFAFLAHAPFFCPCVLPLYFCLRNHNTPRDTAAIL